MNIEGGFVIIPSMPRMQGWWKWQKKNKNEYNS